MQLFDSWAGSLGESDYRRYVQAHSATALDMVREYGVPRIHFGTGTTALLPAMHEAGADVIGVDYRLPLSAANTLLNGAYPCRQHRPGTARRRQRKPLHTRRRGPRRR